MTNALGLREFDIEILTKLFRAQPKITRVKVYGSRAKGTYHERSDIDLVIYGGGVDRFMISNLLLDLQSSDLPYIVDLQYYNDIKNQALREHIDRVGVVFYERE